MIKDNPIKTSAFSAGLFAGTDALAEEVVKEIVSITLLTPKQVRKVLQISQWGFDELVRHGLLNTIRVGHKRLVTLTELKAYIAKREMERNYAV